VEFLDQLSDCKLLKKDSSARKFFITREGNSMDPGLEDEAFTVAF
jgi:hypothetical protein